MEKEHQVHTTMRSNEAVQRPYWRRAHHDWKFWLMVLLMIGMMVFYVLSGNFALL
jgi:hypothetical protein